MARLTEPQIKYLRARYARIQRVDPEGAAFKLLCHWLDGRSQSDLKALVKADIKWVSRLAANRVTGGNNALN